MLAKFFSAAIAAALLLSPFHTLPASADASPSTEPAIESTTESTTDTAPASTTASSTEIPTTAIPTEPTTETTIEITTEPTEPALSPAKIYADRIYTEIMGQAPDEATLQALASSLASHETTVSAAVLTLLESETHTNRLTTNATYVTLLYRALLGHDPDPAGLDHWCEHLRYFSRRSVLRSILGSGEAGALIKEAGLSRGTLSLPEARDQDPALTRFVCQMYLAALDRMPTVGESNAAAGDLLSGTRSLSVICLDLLESDAFVQMHPDDAAYIRALSLIFTGAEPSIPELTAHLDALRTGMTRFSVFLAYAKSDRAAQYLANHGLPDACADLAYAFPQVSANAKYYIYLSPSFDASGLGYVYAGQILTVTGLQGEWLEVSFHNRTGYIHRERVAGYEGEGIRVLPVSNIPQSSNIGGTPLPTGCEVASLSVLLLYLGYDGAGKNLLANTYMPKGTIGQTDPRYAFVGTPEYSSSYGAFSGVMIQTCNNYFNAIGSTRHTIRDISGADKEALYAQIDAGHPVLVWYTMNCTTKRTYGATWSLRRGTSWTEPGTGTYSFTWRNSEHCSVLVGYNRVKDTVILADVWANSGAASGGLTEYSADKFFSAYEWLDRQALIITDEAAPFAPGDVNTDGTVSALDVVLMQQHLVHGVPLTAAGAKAADLDFDNHITAFDLSLLKRKLLQT